MRVAIVAPNFTEYSVHYGNALSKKCSVVTFVDERLLSLEFRDRPLPQDGCQQFCWVRYNTPWHLVAVLYRILRLKPTIIHFQEASWLRGSLYNACIAQCMKPFALIALTVHDPAPHSGRDAAAAKRISWLRDYTRRLADFVVVHGAYCADQFAAYLRPNQTMVTSTHGVVLQPAETRDAPSECHSEPLRLYLFGRMEAYKGLEVLLSAAEQLHRERANFRLLIEGSGPELSRLEHRFSDLPEVTIIAGFVQSTRIMASIQEAHCVVMPYLNATQSGVLAAAFAGHRFVVASDVGGLRDVVRHGYNGILVPPSDANALAEAIRKLIADRSMCVRLREGATTTARRGLNWDCIVDHLFDIFQSTALKKGH